MRRQFRSDDIRLARRGAGSEHRLSPCTADDRLDPYPDRAKRAEHGDDKDHKLRDTGLNSSHSAFLVSPPPVVAQFAGSMASISIAAGSLTLRADIDGIEQVLGFGFRFLIAAALGVDTEQHDKAGANRGGDTGEAGQDR